MPRDNHLVPFTYLLDLADKLYIYALVHPLIEYDVKYVGATLDPTRILNKLNSKSVVSRWCRFLIRQNTEPEVFILQTIDISEDKDSWRAIKQGWVDKFRDEGCELLNKLPTIDKLTPSQRSEVMKIVSKCRTVEGKERAWEAYKLARAKFFNNRRIGLERYRVKERKVRGLVNEQFRMERYRRWLRSLDRYKKRPNLDPPEE